jgi:ATP-dependent RNA helicase RhlE
LRFFAPFLPLQRLFDVLPGFRLPRLLLNLNRHRYGRYCAGIRKTQLKKTFQDLGLAEPILRAVEAEGYTHPTPIQAEVIPEMIQGHDVIGIAQTGTGKTASFVLPILHVLAQKRLDAQKWAGPGPRHFTTLVLAPTRELANQICESIRTYGKFMRPSVALVVGGASPVPQIKALSAGLDIVVATPGRLLDHMRSGKARLDKTTVVVLDEADQMLDLGFMPAIEEIMRKVSQERQVLLLSATMPKPIRALAQEFMRTPKEIAVAAVSKPAEKIQQEVIMVAQSDKNDLLIDLLAAREVDRAIVFTRTKRGTDKVEKMLSDAGLKCIGIHGDKTQGQRNKALLQFKSGVKKILVATDVAARGLDVDDVSHVVNFDMPIMPEAYVHRIGRTGRAGRSGIAISLCDKSERNLLRDIERLTHTALEPQKDLPEHLQNNTRFVLNALPAGFVRKEEPRGRPFGARPGSGAKKPFGKKPSRPFGDKPARAFGDKPARPFGDKPARSFGDQPARAFGDKPVRSFGDRPAAKSFSGKPAGVGGRPAGQGKPAAARSRRPSEHRSASR